MKNKRFLRRLMAFSLPALVAFPAMAATLTITCERADAIWVASKGPLSITYAGDAEGTLELKAPYGELTMPATLGEATLPGSRLIRAFANTTTTMPDLAALETCIAKGIEPGQEADVNRYLTARDDCVRNTPAGAAPIPAATQIDIGIFPEQTPAKYLLTIEIRRRYLEKTKSPDGKTVIENFPTKCELAEK